jgi:DNA helicase-2/ATP-dependent DNA helicase PcrA
MYVAITRAETALFLTESEGFNISTKMNKYPSRFLAEIKREMVVTEGVIPEELWRGTRNLIHVLDEEFDPHRPIDIDSVDFTEERAELRSPFQIGSPVTHPVFGEGVIRGANKEWTTFEVEFADGKVRSLREAFIKPADLPE